MEPRGSFPFLLFFGFGMLILGVFNKEGVSSSSSGTASPPRRGVRGNAKEDTLGVPEGDFFAPVFREEMVVVVVTCVDGGGRDDDRLDVRELIGDLGRELDSDLSSVGDVVRTPSGSGLLLLLSRRPLLLFV